MGGDANQKFIVTKDEIDSALSKLTVKSLVKVTGRLKERNIRRKSK
jgi:hypothetical protein